MEMTENIVQKRAKGNANNEMPRKLAEPVNYNLKVHPDCPSDETCFALAILNKF